MSLSQETIISDEGEDELEQIVEEPEPPVDPRSLLDTDQLEYFKSIFATFDVNNKNVIPTKTIGLVLRLLGLNPTKAQIKEHMKDIDPSNKGLIDFYSFLLPIAQRINEQPETHEDIIAAFRVFDESDLEYLTLEEVYEYLTTFGEDLEDFEIELLLKMAETKGTGRVYYIEFVEKMMGVVRKQPKGKPPKKKGKNKNKFK